MSRRNSEKKQLDRKINLIEKISARKIIRFLKMKRDFVNHTSSLMLANRESSIARFQHFFYKLQEDYRLLAYGLQTISDDPFDNDSEGFIDYKKKYFPAPERESFKRLILTNNKSSPYARTLQSKSLQKLKAKIIEEYNAAHPNSFKKAAYIVNGEFCLEKLKYIGNKRSIVSNLDVEPIENTGLAFITIDRNCSPIDPPPFDLAKFGMEPTPLDLIKHAINIKPSDSVRIMSESIDLNNLYQRIMNDVLEPIRDSEKNINGGTNLVFDLIYALLHAIKASIQRINKSTNSDGILLAQNSLNECQKLILQFKINAKMNQLNKQCEIYRLIIEELQILLLLDDEFDVSIDEALKERHKSRNYEFGDKVSVLKFLTSSGMDAITSAIAAVSKSNSEQENNMSQSDARVLSRSMMSMFGASAPKREVENKFFSLDHNQFTYYEIDGILMSSEITDRKNSGSVAYATYLPSVPPCLDHEVVTFSDFLKSFKAPEQKNNGYYTVIIDITLECDLDILNQFIFKHKTAIENGDLNIILCKSLQKNESLGTGKIMNGELTVINSGEKFTSFNKMIREFSHSDVRQNDVSSRLVRYLLKYASSIVINFEKIALSNMSFIREEVLKSSLNKVSTYENMPILLIINEKYISQFLTRCGIRQRRSFGALETTQDTLPQGTRLSIGIESKNRLIEQLYMLNFINDKNSDRLIQNFLETIDSVGISDNANLVVSEEGDLDHDKLVEHLKKISTDSHKNMLCNNIFCCLISVLTAFRDNCQLSKADSLYVYIIDKILFNENFNITPDGCVYFAKSFLLRKKNESDIDYFNSVIKQIKKCLLILPPIERIDCLINMPDCLIESEDNKTILNDALYLSLPVQQYFFTGMLYEKEGKNSEKSLNIINSKIGNFIIQAIYKKISKSLNGKLPESIIHSSMTELITQCSLENSDNELENQNIIILMKFLEFANGFGEICLHAKNEEIKLLFSYIFSNLKRHLNINYEFDIVNVTNIAYNIVRSSKDKLPGKILEKLTSFCYEGGFNKLSTTELAHLVNAIINSQEIQNKILQEDELWFLCDSNMGFQADVPQDQRETFPKI